MKVETKKNSSLKNIYIREFNNISEFVAYNSMGEVNKKAYPDRQSSITGTKQFTMTNSYQEAEKLLSNGWSEGAKQLTHSLKLANAKPAPREVQRAMHDVVGFQASVPRYLQGIPTNMVNKKKVIQKQKVVTLVKSITYHGGIAAEEILKDSVKFLQILQGLEKQGMRVNAYVAFYSKINNEELFFKIKIKSANERLNISKMSFPLMHPSFLRRIIFRTIEVEPRLTNNGWQDGYGAPGNTNEITSQLEKNEYFIPVLISEQKAKEILMNTK